MSAWHIRSESGVDAHFMRYTSVGQILATVQQVLATKKKTALLPVECAVPVDPALVVVEKKQVCHCRRNSGMGG